MGEFIEHHEFGLALETLIALLITANLEPAAFRTGAASAAELMNMSVSEHLSE